MVTKLIRKSLRAQEKSGHHSVSGRNQELSKVARNARVSVSHVNKCQQTLKQDTDRHKQTEREKDGQSD